MTPRISVIFSTHDRPQSLQRSIDSVLAQSLLPSELLIVHDSPHGIGVDIEEILAVSSDRFRYRRLPTASLTRSRNEGMALAGGDILLLLDDDVILPGSYLHRLAALYQADPRNQVAGIGGVMVERGSRRIGRRAWDAFAAIFALCRWGPRRVAARYVRLPAALKGKLQPAWRLSGGAISLRRCVAEAQRFDESLSGYALGEDLEFSFRVGQDFPLFVAPDLAVHHDVAPQGRPDMGTRGRMYVANFLHILRQSTDPLAGTYLLFFYDMAGTLLRYLLWGATKPNPNNLLFAWGMVVELLAELRRMTRGILCGC